MRRNIRGSRLALTALGLLLLAGCGSRDTPLSELGPEQLWLEGVERFNQEEWNDAIRYLDRYALVAGSDPRVYQARYYSARAHFNRKEYVTAATDFSRLATDLGRLELADDARFMACRAYEELSPGPQLDQEYTRAAIAHCSSLVDYFPDSEFSPRAVEIVDRMWGKLAQKLYEAGEWYLRRRAYDSAMIYFNEVVEQYPQTAWTPRALGKLVGIYSTLQYETEREETLRRLLDGYPDSRAAREHGGG